MSNYSNLKIELMITGENATTWGNVTNTNLGTALEEAIANTAVVTFSSDNQTLPWADTNASQDARRMRLRCTGTTGGSTRNLVVPNIEKPYIVQNDCADSIVVKTNLGTGVTVPAGRTMWVYANGTNVVDVVTHLTSLTLGTALPVLSGGTGSNTTSGARTNLGLGTIATQNANSVTITGGSVTGITDLAVLDGGTGASNAADARTNLGLGTIATQNANSVAITGGSVTGITDLAVLDGGTGASNASGARTNLGAAASGANTDITSLNPSGGLQVGTPTGGAQGTGTINATGLFINGAAVGTGSGSVTSVALSGGTTGLTVSGSPITTSGTITLGGTLAVANGGTGAINNTQARANLGAAASGAATASGLTMSTARILGRTTTGIGALEEISVSTGLSLAGGALALSGVITSTGLLMNSARMLGRSSAGTGFIEDISIGSGLTLSGGVLSATSGGGGTVTSVELSGGTTGLTVSGSPITTSGTITLAGTLVVANGGTGATTLTGVVIGNGTSAFTTKTNPTGDFVGTTDTQTLTNKTLEASNSVNDTGTIAATSVGFRGIPQNSRTSGYTLALTDAGKHISITTGGVTIPANGSVAFPVGTTIVIYNNSSSSQNVSITTDTLRLAGTATTGTRSLAQRGVATCIKVASTEWVITGNVT